ncbi:MAG: substrate-binding domain-containing protein [Lachnospiraceae bacterium]|nr:substrate-binding domain-containing protein [Lachnospiraceae bacterium]
MQNQKAFIKSVIMIGLLECACLFVSGITAAATADPADYQVVMIAKQSDPWFDDMATGVEQLKRDTGLNVSMQYPETTDAAGQAAIMDSLVEQGVDAICVVPNDPVGLLDAIGRARDAGIAVVTHEAPSIADKVDLDVEAFVNESFGELFGQNIAEAVNGTGDYAIIVGSRTMDTHMEWYEAARSYIEENYPNMHHVLEEPAEDGNSMTGAYQVTEELMKKYPDVEGIIECTAYGEGVCKALEDMGLAEKVKVVSLAVPSQTKDYLYNGSLVSILAWRPADAGYATCYAAYLLASGQTVKNGTDFRVTGYESVQVKDGIAYGNAPLEYTVENIEDYMF